MAVCTGAAKKDSGGLNPILAKKKFETIPKMTGGRKFCMLFLKITVLYICI